MMERSLRVEKESRQTWTWGLFAGIVFLCLYFFFTKVTPLYIFDLDDWLYIYNFRRPLPSVAELNPIKVLPETWMPIISYLGTYLLYPFTGDIIIAWSIAYALVLSLMITVYVVAAAKCLGRSFHIQSLALQMAYGAIFLLTHFVAMIRGPGRSYHLFLARDITCIFNYTIPALLNFILWLYFFDQDRQWKPLAPEKMGCLMLGLYLAIFSSLFHSIVLMSLFGMQLLFCLIQDICDNIRQKRSWVDLEMIRSYLKVHYPKLLALLVWFVSMAFQLGGRAEDISDPMQLDAILKALLQIVTERLNPLFLLAVVMINLAAIAVGLGTKNRKFLTQWAKILGSILLTLIYLILITGKLSAEYFLRIDVSSIWLCLVVFLTAFSLAFLVRKIPKMVAAVPVLLACLLMVMVFPNNGYHAYNAARLPSPVVKAISEDVLAQVLEYQAQGLTEAEVLLPESLSDKKWPLDVEMTSERIGEALFRHGITPNKMKIIVIPSPQKDEQLGIK